MIEIKNKFACPLWCFAPNKGVSIPRPLVKFWSMWLYNLGSATAMAQSVKAFALHAEDWVFESQPGQT